MLKKCSKECTDVQIDSKEAEVFFMECNIKREYAGGYKWYQYYYNAFGDIVKTELLDWDENVEYSIEYDYEYTMNLTNQVIQAIRLCNKKIVEKNIYEYDDEKLMMKRSFRNAPYQIADLTYCYEYEHQDKLKEIKVYLYSGELSYCIRDNRIISPIDSKYAWKLLSNSGNTSYIEICELVLTVDLQEELLLYTREYWNDVSSLILDISKTDVHQYEYELMKLQTRYRKKYKINTCYDV